MITNPWFYIFLFIFVIAGAILVIGTLSGLLIGFVASRYSQKNLTRYRKQIQSLLPGTNCGQCKFESCALYADAVLHTQAPSDACPYVKPGAPQTMVAIRKHLQDSLEDPTPVEKKEPRFWDRKF